MGRKFRGNLFLRIFFRTFAGINFRELGFTKDFAGINFRDFGLTKDFAGNTFANTTSTKISQEQISCLPEGVFLWFWE